MRFAYDNAVCNPDNITDDCVQIWEDLTKAIVEKDKYEKSDNMGYCKFCFASKSNLCKPECIEFQRDPMKWADDLKARDIHSINMCEPIEEKPMNNMDCDCDSCM